jgi:hypothetical protein
MSAVSRTDLFQAFVSLMVTLLLMGAALFSRKARQKGVDARDKRGHDAGEVIQSHRNPL